MKAIIAGSRSLADTDSRLVTAAIETVVDDCFQYRLTEIVCGGAEGADRIGEQWGKDHNLPIRYFKPDWSLGRGAGIVRNKQMGKYADVLIALWDGKSKGTAQMIEYMRSLKKPVVEVAFMNGLYSGYLFG